LRVPGPSRLPPGFAGDSVAEAAQVSNRRPVTVGDRAVLLRAAWSGRRPEDRTLKS